MKALVSLLILSLGPLAQANNCAQEPAKKATIKSLLLNDLNAVNVSCSDADLDLLADFLKQLITNDNQTLDVLYASGVPQDDAFILKADSLRGAMGEHSILLERVQRIQASRVKSAATRKL